MCICDHPDDSSHSQDLEFTVHTVINSLPMSEERKLQLQAATANDLQLQQQEMDGQVISQTCQQPLLES